MASPPTKKSKESTTISMEVNYWKDGQVEQFSPVQRINGIPWRLRLYNDFIENRKADKKRTLSLVCDKSIEAELWKYTAEIKFQEQIRRVVFKSWDSNKFVVLAKEPLPSVIAVTVDVKSNGEMWRCRPTLNPFDPRDGVLVIGADKKKIYVNKESLASQSSYFEKLFKSDFKEKNMSEIPIGDVEYEEFSNFISMVYGFDGASLTDVNVRRVLQLADRFDLKIVEDRIVSFLLSSNSSLSICQKLIISDQHNLPFVMECLISELTSSRQLKNLCGDPAWDLLPRSIITTLFKKACDLGDINLVV